MAHHTHITYAQNNTRARGKRWWRYNECRVAQPACSEGNAPKTTGEAEKEEVYNFVPKRMSILSRPPGEPFME